jgi:hypothetical protein
MRTSLVLAALLVFAVRVEAAVPRLDPDSRVRPVSNHALALLAEGADRSPTFRRLLREIETSDVIVHVEARLGRASLVAASTRFITSSGGSRYLRVLVDAAHPRHVQIALLGHELQHVVEIVGTPSIRSADDLRRHYREHGVEVGVDRYDTIAARDTGYTVGDELRRSRGALRVAELTSRERRLLDSVSAGG